MNRKQFVEGGSREEALAACPWAGWCIEADGGWMCFENEIDATDWQRQQ